MVVIKLLVLGLFIAVGATHINTGELHAVRAERLHRHPPGRGDRLLRLHRLRRDLDGGGGDEEPAAQPADRHPRRPGDLHLIYVVVGFVLTGMVPYQGAGASRIRWRTRCSSPASTRSAGSSRSARWSRCRRCCSSSSTASRASSSRWRATACCRSGPRRSTRRRGSRSSRRSSPGIFVALWSLIGDAGETYDLTNIGTLFAFMLVSIGVLVLRYTEPDRPRPFRVPFVWPVCAPVGAPACVFIMKGLPHAGVGAVRLLAGDRAGAVLRLRLSRTASCDGREPCPGARPDHGPIARSASPATCSTITVWVSLENLSSNGT